MDFRWHRQQSLDALGHGPLLLALIVAHRGDLQNVALVLRPRVGSLLGSRPANSTTTWPSIWTRSIGLPSLRFSQPVLRVRVRAEEPKGFVVGIRDIEFALRESEEAAPDGVSRSRDTGRAGSAPWRGLHPHALRHFAATSWLRNGVGLDQVRRLLGHASLNTTLRYSNLVAADLQQAHKEASAIERIGVTKLKPPRQVTR